MAGRPKWMNDQKPLEVGCPVWILGDMTPRGIRPVVLWKSCFAAMIEKLDRAKSELSSESKNDQ